jgi:hypothetical protein
MSEAQTVAIFQESTPLFPETQRIELIKQSLVPQGRSVGRAVGRAAHPINMTNAINTMYAVSTQMTCIQTKRDATVGLGFETEEDRKKREDKKALDQVMQSRALGQDKPSAPPPKPVAKVDPPSQNDAQSKVEQILDPLCGEFGFQSLINQTGEDYENTGNGYFEAIRETPGGPVTELWHVPAPAVFVNQEAKAADFHFEVDDTSGKTLKFARFGDLEEFRSRFPTLGQERVTELVHFKMPTAASPHYGLPQWLAGIVWLELAQHALSFENDYYQNRAVPDLMLLLTGRKVNQEDIDKIKEALKKTIGPGQRHRTLVFNFEQPELNVKLERLTNEDREKISESWPSIELGIVSAHRVPPLLAGIVTPGKMAAANELPNALVAFQTLYIEQHQRIFSKVLGSTLGSQEAGLGLAPTDFLLRRITDRFDMGQMDTMSQMRQTATEASQQGRKLSDGLKQ